MTVEQYAGHRSRIRALFELAEDSRRALDAYIDAGEVIVALDGAEPIGHTASVQATPMAEGVYANAGFRDLGRYLEYTPQ